MRAVIRVSLIGLALGLAVCPVGAGGNEDRVGEMDAAARAFLKAYQAKDLDALLKSADAPFAVGSLRAPTTLKTSAELRAELKSRLSAGGKLPTRVAKTLTWDQGITKTLSPDEERKTRAILKPAMKVTGEDGGYAALANPMKAGKRTLMEMTDLRLLVAIRGGKAKVVGILKD